MLIEDRVVETLSFLEDTWEIERFLARDSESFLVWLGALLGMIGASSVNAGEPK